MAAGRCVCACVCVWGGEALPGVCGAEMGVYLFIGVKERGRGGEGAAGGMRGGRGAGGGPGLRAGGGKWRGGWGGGKSVSRPGPAPAPGVRARGRAGVCLRVCLGFSPRRGRRVGVPGGRGRALGGRFNLLTF